MLKPLWDSIDVPEDVSLWDTPEWEAQPKIVQMLDCLMRQEGFIGTPMSSVLMMTGMWDITEDNVAEVYGRMRTYETLAETTMLNGVGDYDPETDTFTSPESITKGYPLSPWVLSQFIGYSANWGRKSRTEWVKWMREQPEGKPYTAKHIKDTIDMYAKAYTDAMSLVKA
jgi:hypothetical protein